MFTVEGCGCLEMTDFCEFLFWRVWVDTEWQILNYFHFGRIWWSWKDRFGFAESWCIELQTVVCLCVCVSVNDYTGQRYWLNWPVANSSNVVGLHHHHYKCWHHCLLFGVLFLMWLMPVSLYVACILAYFPHWWTFNLGMWHFKGIFLLVHICYGK